jgi:SAM-dependent methyltransferase
MRRVVSSEVSEKEFAVYLNVRDEFCIVFKSILWIHKLCIDALSTSNRMACLESYALNESVVSCEIPRAECELQVVVESEVPGMCDKLAQMRHRFTRKFISEHIPFGSRILDIGVGGAQYWSRFDYDVIGVDVHRGRFVDHVLDVEKDKLEEIGEKFHFVTMFDVIEHLENPLKALRNIRNVMTDDALFLGSTPNRMDPYLFLGKCIHPDHNYVFDKLTLQHMLAKCGFWAIEMKNRVFPIKLSRKIFVPIDMSQIFPTGRVLFWRTKKDPAV